MKCTYEGINYRTMPPELLNSNIPIGRGMIKWMPFKTMPEQYENVDKLMEQNTNVPKPILNEDLLQEIELELRKLQGCNVILRYWNDGYECQQECVIEQIDNWSRIVTVSKEGSVMYIQFEYIYSIDKYDYFAEL